jgi:nucleotide-binding universal stress UspA family protein
MPLIDGILCPVDFSDRSLEALDRAFELSEEFSSNLYVLHVIKDFARDAAAIQAGVGFGIESFRDQLHADAMRQVDQLIESRTPVRTGVLGVVEHGDPAVRIAEEADRRDADLIVIASRGRSMLGRLVLGSVTERVLQISECPVLVIPPSG